MTFQMMIVILVGVFGGYYLDKWLDTKPVFIVIISLLSVFLSIYLTIKDLIKKKE
jgi:F0F1-type ATP synthase assembly protein I